jgi:hypothetical protein
MSQMVSLCSPPPRCAIIKSCLPLVDSVVEFVTGCFRLIEKLDNDDGRDQELALGLGWDYDGDYFAGLCHSLVEEP